MSLKLGLLASSQQQAAPLLLDAFPGAQVAYSLRKLRTAYAGFCINVRRSSDNATLNIGFNGSNTIDTTALLTFVGANNGFVTQWYDQSGNGNNASGGSSGVQPQIVFSGSLLIKNSKPYISADPSKEFALNTAITKNAADPYGWWFIYEKNNAANQPMFVNGGGQYLWLDYDTAQIVTSSNSFFFISPALPINTLFLINFNSVSSAVNMYSNGSLRGSVSPIVGSGSLLQFAPQFKSAKITMTEFVFYSSNQTGNRIGIQNNINSFYSIF